MPADPVDEEARPSVVVLWDPVIRGFHWAIVALVSASLILGHFGPADMTLHFWSGYGVAALLCVRLIWGFVGPGPARLVGLVYRPTAILRYALTLPRRKPSDWPGHNPLGGLSVIAMLLLLSAQVATGLFADPEDYINYGPLAEYVGAETNQFASGWHERLGYALLALIALHVSIIVFYRVWKRENLYSAMIRGGRLIPENTKDKAS